MYRRSWCIPLEFKGSDPFFGVETRLWRIRKRGARVGSGVVSSRRSKVIASRMKSTRRGRRSQVKSARHLDALQHGREHVVGSEALDVGVRLQRQAVAQHRPAHAL